MTDRLKGFVVTFNHPIREDDAEVLRKAILMLKPVHDVQPVLSEPFQDHIAASKARLDLEREILEVFAKHRG